MSAILLALGSALAYGAADFMAGVLSRRSNYARVSLLAQITSAAGSILASLVVGGRPSASSLAWGALSGLGGGLGTLALYRGLARGRMNVVAPLSAVLAAALPALFGFLLGERPGSAAMAGLGLALPAVWLTARTEDQAAASSGAASSGALDGLLAGLGFSVLFIALQRAGRGEGLWPTAASQIVGVLPMLALHAGALRRPLEAQDRWVRLGPLLAGVLVALAAILFFLGTQRGLLTVVAVLTSLYPAVTIALARWLLAERIGRWQGVGLALAAVSVALISGG
ncbi:MAG TPA: DMT family transporter [Myxococcaceae bacterium]|nr:DMT family transporter [Myxococcaceae bacterium]